MFVGLEYTSQGNYKCLFCNHPVYKSAAPAEKHVTERHPKERAELLSKKLQEAQSKPARIEYREKVVYKDKPEPEWQKSFISIYCPTCCIVETNARLPVGQTIEDTPHSKCNVTGLMMVTKVS